MVRISLAAYNTVEDLDALVEMLIRITEGRYHGAYRQVPESGDYVPDTQITGTETSALPPRSFSCSSSFSTTLSA